MGDVAREARLVAFYGDEPVSARLWPVPAADAEELERYERM